MCKEFLQTSALSLGLGLTILGGGIMSTEAVDIKSEEIVVNDMLSAEFKIVNREDGRVLGQFMQKFKQVDGELHLRGEVNTFPEGLTWGRLFSESPTIHVKGQFPDGQLVYGLVKQKDYTQWKDLASPDDPFNAFENHLIITLTQCKMVPTPQTILCNAKPSHHWSS